MGRPSWIGRDVFGSSGDLGIRRDGTHATHLVVEADAVVDKPASISWEEAAGIGVPFVTAMEGLRRAGLPKAGETVLVMGVNGKVGQAAVQIATWQGARAIGVVRKREPYEGHSNTPVEVIDASSTDVAARVRELTAGKGADIVYNTVGDPYFEAANKSLALRGRQILIAAVERIVPFNILDFYRGQHTYVGIDTLGLSSIATGAVLRELAPGFASGHLKPFPITPRRFIRWNRRRRRVHCRGRIVARPRDSAARIGAFRMDARAQSSCSRALVIGLVYGAIGLLSGFCMLSSLRGWWAEGDGRLVRTYALAMGVAIAASQGLAAAGLVDLGKSIYLQPTLSAPVLFLGGLLFGYGMVLSNGCGSRALVLLGRGNLRSLVVVIILAIFAQMTLKGLIAPSRIAMVGASQTTTAANSLPALLAALGLSATAARMIAASALAAALIIFAFADAPFRQSPGQITAGIIMGLLVAGGWYATGYLGADDFNPVP